MKLKRHGTWGIYGDQTSSLGKFVQNFVPDMKLRNEVSQEVFKTYNVIRSLIVHSYYEYEFVDVAVTKLLQTFEMALKIRYKELNDEDWPINKPLAQLIEWFRKREYFEVNHEGFMEHVRKARNSFSHPQSHSFGGLALFHWFDTITDLINDVHEDVKKRKRRLAEMKNLNENIRKIVNEGAKINLILENHIICEADILFHEEIGEKKNYLFYYKRLFKLDENGELLPNQKPPFQLMELKNYDFEFSQNVCKIGPFSIKKLSDSDEQQRFSDWIAEFRRNKNYHAYNAFLDFQIQEHAEEKRREAIHSKHFLD